MPSTESATARRKKRSSDTQLPGGDEEETAPRSTRQSNGTRANGSKRQKLLPASSDVDDDATPGENEDDDDDDEEEDSRSEGEGTLRKGKARALMNGNGHGGEEADEDEDDAAPPPLVTHDRLYERHADGYVTGSITRIKLTDFMTYDFVEFNPGPHLNMILGPNGTGKSTIAAGIAIGLGFKPEVMGRATDIQSYVKQGKEEAWTELDVRGKKGKRNYTIWRRFGKDGRSEWRLNGNSAKRREVLELVASFGIQANNLCCFLAQDRVSEFAKMAPPLTLRETMRAAGDPRLTEWHEKLIEKGQEKKTLDEKVGENVVRRDQVQAQVDILAPDVEHFENRQNQEIQRDLLTIWVEYCRAKELKQAYEESQLEFQAIVEQIKDVNRNNRPLKDLLEYHGALETRASNKVQKAEDELKTANHGRRQERRKIVDTVDEFENIDSQIAQAKKRIARRAKTIADLETNRDNAEAQLKIPREQLLERSRMRQQSKRDCEKEKREIEHKLRGIRAARLDKEREVKDIGRGIDDKMERLRKLGSIEKLRTEAAIESNGSIGAALDWLQQHAAELEHPVIIPASISLNVPNQRYASQIEQALSFAQLSTFICQSQHDYDKMLQLNNTRYEGKMLSNGRRTQGGVVSLHLVTVSATEDNVHPRRPCSEERMRQLGLDGCANDFVEADPVMIAWLNEKCNFNRTAITSRPMGHISVNDVAQLGFTSILSQDESLRIIKSAYGKKANQFSSQTLKTARSLNRVVDQAAVTGLNEEISDLKRRKVECEKPLTDLDDQIRTADSDFQKANARLSDLDRDFSEALKALKEWDKSKAQIDLFEKELDKIHSEPSMAEQRDKLEKQKLAAALKCIPHISTLATYQEEGNTHIADCISASLAKLQATTNRSAIDRKHESRNREVIELSRKKERAAERRATLRAQYMAKSAAMEKRVQEEATPQVRRELRTRTQDVQMKTQTVAEAQAELAQVEAELEISQGVNPQVIVRYKRLCKELEDVSKEVSDQEADLNKVKKSIDTILAKFEPALDTLVSTVSARFAAAFDRNGCAGDVRLTKPEDGYEHWGLVPHVSFRDGEAMQPLTGQRQSGGERSYSTIMYLMALSAMARVPFSLVDEINQGMDQQAERTVFNQLVETTCAESAGQYFLITPKLLTGLTYHPKMKVLIVNNGPWLPEGTDKKQKFGDLRGCLQRYKRSIAA